MRILSGRECAALLREWITTEDFGGYRMPPAGVDMILEEIPWRDSDEPVGTGRDLYREYVKKVSRPIRLYALGRLLGRRAGDG